MRLAEAGGVEQLEFEVLEQGDMQGLRLVIDYNDAEAIERYLAGKGADLLHKKDESGGAMHWAAQRGRDKAVRTLIKLGADIDEQDCLGRTPLLVAVENTQIEVVKVLLEARAHINVVGAYNSTPLRAASGAGAADIINLLIDGGANIRPLRADGKTALHTVNGDFNSVKALLDAGVRVNHQDKHGKTALYYMVSGGKISDETMALLLRSGAEPRITEGDENSVRHGYPELFTQEKLIIYAKYDMVETDINSTQQIHGIETMAELEVANASGACLSAADRILHKDGGLHANSIQPHPLRPGQGLSWVSLIKSQGHN